MRKIITNGRLLSVVGTLSLALGFTACRSTRNAPTPMAAELEPLQGSWEGSGAGGPCSITIAGDSLHYRAGTNWWRTTFTLPAGTDPRQLHATIRESSTPDSGIGTTVFALYSVNGGELTLAVDDGAGEAP